MADEWQALANGPSADDRELIAKLDTFGMVTFANLRLISGVRTAIAKIRFDEQISLGSCAA